MSDRFPLLSYGIKWASEAIDIINDAIKKANRAASATEEGVIEIATDAEALAKTATDKALVPSNLAAIGATETFAGLVELATVAEAEAGTDTARAVTPAGVLAAVTGKKKRWVPVDEMTALAAAAPAAAVMTGTALQWNVLDFDQTAAEVAVFTWSAPSSWDEGTVTFVPVWTASAGAGAVVWGLQGVAMSNDEALSFSYTTTAASTDTLLATGDLHRGPESSALTVEGTPATNDLILFRVLRSPASGGDTLTADARLIGIELFYTTAAAVDVA